MLDAQDKEGNEVLSDEDEDYDEEEDGDEEFIDLDDLDPETRKKLEE